MKDFLLKAKLLLTQLWGHVQPLLAKFWERVQPYWTLCLARWNALLEKLSTVKIPVINKQLSPRTIGILLPSMGLLILISLLIWMRA